VAATAKILQCLDGCEMLECTETIIMDHWGFLIDVNLERYFQSKPFSLDINDSSKLDSRRATHKEKFDNLLLITFSFILPHEIIEKFYNEDDYINANRSS